MLTSQHNADKFTKIKFQHFTISTLNKRDSGCLMKNGEIVLVKKIKYNIENKTCYLIVCNRFLLKNDLYVIPCKSSDLGIFSVSKLPKSSNSWPIDFIDKKMFVYKMSSITLTYAAFSNVLNFNDCFYVNNELYDCNF